MHETVTGAAGMQGEGVAGHCCTVGRLLIIQTTGCTGHFPIRIDVRRRDGFIDATAGTARVHRQTLAGDFAGLHEGGHRERKDRVPMAYHEQGSHEGEKTEGTQSGIKKQTNLHSAIVGGEMRDDL